jgi:hypothetical protein
MNLSQSGTTLSGWRLILARMLWIIVFLLCFGVLLALLPVISRLTEREWLVVSSYPAIKSLMTYTSYVRYLVVLRYIALAIFLTAALIIYWRRPRDWIALLASATLVLIPSAFFFSIEYPAYSQPWHAILELIKGAITLLAIVSLILFFNLFPDGKSASRKMTIWVTLSVGMIIILMISMSSVGEFFYFIFIIAFMIVLLISVSAQLYRYRHMTSTVHRQQIKWVLLSFSMTAVGFLGMIMFSFIQLGLAEAPVNFITLHVITLMLTSIPVAMVISIFRYRLWDIDIIIRRALVYGSLSFTLLIIYLVSVVFFQNLITALHGPQSEVGIAISTLFIAALFSPLRRRIQRDIDHRFYREKYNAEQALARFVSVARDETNLVRLESTLLQVIQETVQPETISLWMRDFDES